MNKSKLKVCIYDLPGSSYLPQALKLAPYFEKAYYYVDYKSPFPLIAPQKPGTGYPQIEVITEFWANLDNFDLVIFPDIYSKDIGTQLKKAGKLIFGGGPSEDIETNRGLFYSILERLNMNNANFGTIQGITKLKAFLKNKKNKYIKLSYFRGQIETFKWLNQNYNQQQLDELEFELGPNGDSVEFIVQDLINADAEFGFDGYAVNGQLPSKFIQGIEIKDCGYLGKVDSITSAPSPITEINQQFSPALQAYAHTGFYSTEVRYNSKTKESYYIDPCMRMGNPPSNVYLSLINNWDKIIVEGAKGNLVEPTFKGKYGVEIILKSSYILTRTICQYSFQKNIETILTLKEALF